MVALDPVLPWHATVCKASGAPQFITVLALLSLTDCKCREARRVQPCKMPQPATHRAPAVASREIWGPAPHLYPQKGPHGAASSPYLPKHTQPQVSTSHLGTAMASLVLPTLAMAQVPPSYPVPSSQGCPPHIPTCLVGANIFRHKNSLEREVDPGSRRSVYLLAANFYPKFNCRHYSLEHIHFSPI